MKITSLQAAVTAGFLCLGLGAIPASAQATKPAESTSKVKKVLLYNKIGGWVHTDGSSDVKKVMTGLAAAKKFELTQLESESNITLNYLKGFNVIVWNNNTNGASSVSNATARTAIIEYVNQGGGWLLIHGAGDHADSWVELKNTMGTKFTVHGAQGPGEAVVDTGAKNHKELKFMVQTVPATFKLTDEWYAFQNSVRPLAGVTVVATARSAGTNGVVVDYGDKTTDKTYIWARAVQTGRVIYNAIGHGQNSLMAQADSVVPKLYWENLRYLAGDYKNGCTNKQAGNFDSTARVDDASCTSVGIGGVGYVGKTQTELSVDFSAFQSQRVTMPFTHSGKYSLEMRDATGSLVWNGSNLENSSLQINKPLRSGIYYLKAVNGKNTATHKVILL
jgi:type 1 glutamine amidotransferase